MKMKFFVFTALFLCLVLTVSAQQSFLDGKEVFKNDDVVFHQIDGHTWVGTGKMVYNESMYLVEGTDKAILIDAGTNIKDLDKIVASALAIARQAGRNWVFVERAGGFEPVPVEVHSQAAQAVSISGPFAGNERIVVQGVAALKSAWQGGGE